MPLPAPAHVPAARPLHGLLERRGPGLDLRTHIERGAAVRHMDLVLDGVRARDADHHVRGADGGRVGAHDPAAARPLRHRRHPLLLVYVLLHSIRDERKTEIIHDDYNEVENDDVQRVSGLRPEAMPQVQHIQIQSQGRPTGSAAPHPVPGRPRLTPAPRTQHPAPLNRPTMRFTINDNIRHLVFKPSTTKMERSTICIFLSVTLADWSDKEVFPSMPIVDVRGRRAGPVSS